MREAAAAVQSAVRPGNGSDAAVWVAQPVSQPTGIDRSDFLAKAGVGTLFLFLSISLLQDFVQTHQFTGLLLLTSEALVVVMTIVRRRATVVDRSLAAAVIATISLVGPPLLRPGIAAALLPDAATASVAVAGLCLVIAGKAALGRSFGIVPANRGIVVRGPYLFVRHPIYAGYLLTHAAFVAAHPTITNIVLVVASDGALVLRALYEERTLLNDEGYRSYCGRVRWHFAPGLF